MVRATKTFAKYLFLSILFWPVGIFCHEVMGHGLVGVLCGGRIGRVEILRIQIWPTVERLPWRLRYGACQTVDVTAPVGTALTKLAGAGSTFVIATIATALLLVKRRGRIVRAVLITLSLWWIDMMAYTLPSWGIRHSVFFGQNSYSEPYEGAVSLGVPGTLFQGAVVLSCLTLVGALIYSQTRQRAVINAKAPNPGIDTTKEPK